MRETWVWSQAWEDPLKKGTTTHSSILAWRIVHGVSKSWTQLSDFHFHFICLSYWPPSSCWNTYISLPEVFGPAIPFIKNISSLAPHPEKTLLSLSLAFFRSLFKCHFSEGLPWWLSGEEATATAGDMGSILGPGRSHIPRRTKSEHQNYWSPCTLESLGSTREATAMISLSNETREWPLLAANNEKPKQQWRLSTAKTKTNNFFF